MASVSRNPREVETVWPANCPVAEFSRPASEYGWSEHPGPGACPPRPRDRSRMPTRPSRVLPVPEGDHGHSAMVVVTLRGSQR